MITARTVALPVPPGPYSDLNTGKPGEIFWLADMAAGDPNARGPNGTLNQFTLQGPQDREDRRERRVTTRSRRTARRSCSDLAHAAPGGCASRTAAARRATASCQPRLARLPSSTDTAAVARCA